MDGRSKEARLVRHLTAELVAHCGGNPSVTQREIIERIGQIKLRIAVMDRAFTEAGTMTPHDAAHYYAAANTLTRLLARLGLQGAPTPTPTLADYLASRDAASAAQASPAPAPGTPSPETPAPAQRVPEAAD
jgi:hypothetical protein